MPVGVKLAALCVALVVNLFVEDPRAGFVAFALACALLLRIGGGPRRLASRLTAPLSMIAFVFLTQLFWYDGEKVASLSIAGMTIALSKDGLVHGLAVASRALAGYAFVLLFIETTSHLEVLRFARDHRLPPAIIDIASMTTRFAFVLRDRAGTIREAQILRYGYSDFRKGLRAVGILGGKLAIDSFDRSVRVFEAMKLRGYRS